MKRSLFAVGFAALLATAIGSCADNDELLVNEPCAINMHSSETTDFKRSEPEALNIAQAFFSAKKSRTSNDLSLEYATTGAECSRSDDNATDTVAYIVTPSDSDGFMLISTDKRMPEVLAFSETGRFNLNENPENNLAKTYFIDDLSKYKDYCIKNTNGYDFPLKANLFDKMIEFYKGWNWSQYNSPFVDTVRIHHQYAPVGCVGLATAMVLTHCLDSVEISGITYQLAAIRRGFILPTIIGRFKGPTPADPGLVYPYLYTPIKAHSELAKLLYYIGLPENLHLTYYDLPPTEKGEDQARTSGSNSTAFSFLKRVGCTVISPRYDVPFDEEQIADHIIAGDIAMMSSSVYQLDSIGQYKYHCGHAWVVDGCCFDYDDQNPNAKKNLFLHCNWGVGDGLVGYYYGEVFQVAYSYQSKKHSYFAIKQTANIH